MTVNPYLGVDSLASFLTYHNNEVFVLTRTSNAGASWLQDIQDEAGCLIYERIVASLAASQVGFVVSATAPPDALDRVRRLAFQAWILALGVGVQGADLEADLQF